MQVALHPEGVDRNYASVECMLDPAVALHTEGVDRNTTCSGAIALVEPSPSTRRAWIEITVTCLTPRGLCVTLHPEGADRNSTR